MGVALICWGRFVDANGNKITVPAPTTDPDKPWLLDFLYDEAPRLAGVGFSVLQLPPVSKAQGGAYAGCDGYGVFDPRDLGSKNQQGGVPTRYGTVEQLRRLVAYAHTHGLEVYLDMVMHQRIGANAGPGTYRYVGANGVKDVGRGAMNPGCFREVAPADRPEDDVPVPADDFSFGDEVDYEKCEPPRYTIDDALDYGDWTFRTTDADGARFDDTKGMWPNFVHEFMTSRAMAQKFFYSEFFDGNPALLDQWANSPVMQGRSSVEDFTLHWALQSACNGNNAYPLNGAGYIAQKNAMQACTFVDNPDTDTSPGQQVISNKLLAYAFLLTSEGYPFVYGKDYYGGDVWPGAYGLHKWIDNLVWIHERLANGGTMVRYLSNAVIVYERLGAPGLLVALNFDTQNAHTVSVNTNFGANVHLHSYSPFGWTDTWTSSNGGATFTVPANHNNSGQSYLCFSRAGIEGGVPRPSKATTQVFFGAYDLDTTDAKPNVTAQIARIYAEVDTAISADLIVNAALDVQDDDVVYEVRSPDGTIVLQGSKHAVGKVPETGWHTIQITGQGTVPAKYELSVTYHGA